MSPGTPVGDIGQGLFPATTDRSRPVIALIGPVRWVRSYASGHRSLGLGGGRGRASPRDPPPSQSSSLGLPRTDSAGAGLRP